MKKTAFLMLLLLLLCGCAAGESESGKIKIVTTVFPAYDWARELAGDVADISLMADDGVDMHSYQPNADDIIAISTCDVFIYIGGESDKWVGDILKEAVNRDMNVINLMNTLGDAVKDEEAVEGMEHEHEEEAEADEHIWLSSKNARVLCSDIAKALAQKDPENAELYAENARVYDEKLAALDGEYVQAVQGSKHKTLVFCDRFPFRYLLDDYGIDYYAAFAGCSAETEASVETVVFLAKKVDELGVDCVVTIDGSDAKIAETVIANTKSKNQKIITLDSMQAVLKSESYVDIMRSNLETLKEALN